MRIRAAILSLLFFASVLLSTAISASALAPVEINDLVGKWRSNKNKKKIITLVREGDELKLQTPEYSDWKPLKIDAGTRATHISFGRTTTESDVARLQMDHHGDTPPDAVVKLIAGGEETEAFDGFPERKSNFTGSLLWKECALTMDVRWRGFHVDWEGNTVIDRTEPKPVDEKFTQIRYVWPDLRKTVATTLYNGNSSTGTEISSYFSERPGMEVYGEFGIAILKPIFSAVGEAVPAETLLGKIAQKLFEKSIEQSLRGDLKMRDLAEAVVGQVLGKALEGVADREPFAGIRSKLEDVYTEDLAKAGGHSVVGKSAEKLTAAEKDALEKYLAKQCRYELVQLKSYGAVLGGIAVVDSQTGNATVWLFLKERGTEPRVVMGSTSVPEENEHTAISLSFSPIGI